MLFDCVLIEILKTQLLVMEFKDIIALKKDLEVYKKKIKELEKLIQEKEKTFENKDNIKMFGGEACDGRAGKDRSGDNC